MPDPPRVSVVTPTYDRSAFLPRLHESLVAQTFEDFEWVVVDDGSTDGTGELIRGLKERSRFPIRYLWQPNGGRHIALNRGVQEARGEYCAVIDSDDWYPPDALERMILHWDSMSREERERFANVEGLCTSGNGMSAPVRELPQAVLDTDNFSIIAKYHVKGDKKGMYRTSVLREFPFPAQPRTFIPEGTVFFQIAERYQSRFVNEIWGFNEYQPGGLSQKIATNNKAFAYGFRLFNKTLLSLELEKPKTLLFKAYVNFVRYSMHEGIGLRTQMAETPSRLAWLSALPFGAALFIRDSFRAGRRARA